MTHVILAFTLTPYRTGPTHKELRDGAPDPDGPVKEEVRIKSRHYRNIYLNRPDPITFLPSAVDTSVRLYDDFIRLLSCMIVTMRHLRWLMNCRRNRISFDSFALLDYLI